MIETLRTLPKKLLSFTSEKTYKYCHYDYLFELHLAEVNGPRGNSDRWKELEEEGRGKYWLGVETLKEFLDTVGPGHQPTIDKIIGLEGEMRKVIQKTYAQKRKRQKDEFGDELDIHSVYAGNLKKAWTICRREKRKGKRKIAIYTEFGGNSNVDAEDMFWSPVAAIALSSLFIKSRYMVELNGCHVCDGLYLNESWPHYITVRLKDFSQPLSIPQISPVALGGMLRYFGFKSYCRQPEEVCHSMGSSRENPKDLLTLINHNIPTTKNIAAIYIPRLHSKKEAIKLIENIIETYFSE